jgi:hypothetical protein
MLARGRFSPRKDLTMSNITNKLLVTAALVAVALGGHRLAEGHSRGGLGHEGGGTAVCTTLVIDDPVEPLDGYTLFSPDEKQNNPNAGEPFYVFLAGGSEAVVIDGPTVPSAPGLFTLDRPVIAMVGATPFSGDGYVVLANSGLRYDVAIADFEYEVALARVELCEKDHAISSRFVFRGNPVGNIFFGGVAHDITITGTVRGATTAPTTPVTVEVR